MYVKALFSEFYNFKQGNVKVAADNWNYAAERDKDKGGINFSTYDKVLRWLVRGDTLCDVIIPEDAIVLCINSPSCPNGIFRADKVILTNPRPLTNELVLDIYRKTTDLPWLSYIQSAAGCAISGCVETAKIIFSEHTNSDNIKEALNIVLSWYIPGDGVRRENLERFTEWIKEKIENC